MEGERRDEGSQPHFRNPGFWICTGIVFCTLANSLLGEYSPSADVVAYLDISDLIRAHQWHSVVNGYWFPLYPALLAIARVPLGSSLHYELMAARLMGAATNLLFIAATVFLVDALWTLQVNRGIAGLVPRGALRIWAAVFSFSFSAKFLTWITPDSVLSALILLIVGFLVRAVAKASLPSWITAGIAGGFAFWTKTFALPFVALSVIFIALLNVRRTGVLRGLAAFSVVFLGIAAPWIWQLSSAEGKLSYGATGGLAAAWYVDGADRFNPVADPSLFHPGDAKANFRHPGELLSKHPEVVYFDRRVPGSTPQWDDPAFWSEGLTPRFVLHRSVTAFRTQAIAVIRALGGDLEILALIAALPMFGFGLRKGTIDDPLIIAVSLIALAGIGVYALVLVEGRYVVFAFVIVGTLYAACCTARLPEANRETYLRKAILLIAVVIILSHFDGAMSDRRRMVQAGGNPLRGIYSQPVVAAGARLAKDFPAGTEIACMGDLACWNDPYWARYAHVRMSTVIETGNGWDQKDASIGCEKLKSDPSVLDTLRKRNLRAIVAVFEEAPPCSAQWKHMDSAGDFFYLPL